MEEIIVERQSKLPLILRDLWNKGTKGAMFQNYAFTNIVFSSKQRERNLLLTFQFILHNYKICNTFRYGNGYVAGNITCEIYGMQRFYFFFSQVV
jgi:hypothetical protein